MKIVSLGDIHIRNLKYHNQYKQVFQRFHESLRKDPPNAIIMLGDLCHTKVAISPEYVEIASDFLKTLADIANTYCIVGNHDAIIRNTNRQDSISPLIKSLNHSNLFLLKESQEKEIEENIVLNIFSIIDKDNWIETPSDPTKTNIALYHGSVSGCQTDTGWTMDYGDVNVNTFRHFDYVMLGDIHKTYQVMQKQHYAGNIKKPFCVYGGSFIQQNHSETNDKGFLLWDIKNKKDFNVKHVVLDNPSPFISIELTEKGKLPKNIKDIKDGSKIRLIANSNVSFEKIKKAINVVTQKFKPENITFLNRALLEKKSNGINGIEQKDLRDIAVQEELINKYLKDYQVDKNILEKVFELNRKYNSVVKIDEEIGRNIEWKPKILRWKNLFNFGDGNEINFERLRGVVGIFGKNFSGKSSIVECLLFTLYSIVSKNSRKNINIINQNRTEGYGYVEIEIGNKKYTIKRTIEKYEKKLKNETTIEARIDVDFKEEDLTTNEVINLNADTRPGTDKNIRRIFGSIEDFLITSMSSQFGALSYISEGSTKRKEILARFLDLEVFEKKFRVAKDEISDIKSIIKRLEEKDFFKEKEEAQLLLQNTIEELEIQKKECEKFKKEGEQIQKEISDIENIIKSIPAEIIDIKKVEKSYTKKKEIYQENILKNTNYINEIEEKKIILSKIEEFLRQTFNIEEYKEKHDKINILKKEVEDNKKEIKHYNLKLKNANKKTELLKEVPCDDRYSHCKFIKDAHEAKGIVEKNKEILEKTENSIIETEKIIKGMEPEKIEDYLFKYEQLIERQRSVTTDLMNLKLSKQKNETQKIHLEGELEKIKAEIDNYYENEEKIKNKFSFIKQKSQKERELSNIYDSLELCENKVADLHKKHGSHEHKIQNLNEQEEELEKLRQEYEAYDLFLRCMHSDGIAYDIIKSKLPIINDEISKILANVVNFEVFFEADGKKLDIFIKHPKFEPRPIEMGSGAEVTISATAIRMALLTVTSLPKSDIYITDEPGTALDEESMDGLIRIMDLAKSYFKTVILISHLEFLKDIADMQIIIEKRNGFAYVKQ